MLNGIFNEWNNYTAVSNGELHTCAFGVSIARKIPKNVIEAAYSHKIIQNSKKFLTESVATPPIVKHIEQKISDEIQR
jgi:hypothetical protein